MKNYERYLLKDCFDNITPCFGLTQYYRDRIFLKKLLNATSAMIKLYCRYNDDTLLIMIPADIPHVYIYIYIRYSIKNIHFSTFRHVCLYQDSFYIQFTIIFVLFFMLQLKIICVTILMGETFYR